MTTQQLSSNTKRKTGFPISLKTLQLIFIALGTLVSAYLTYVKATSVPMVCVENSVFNCEAVQNSAYSLLFGIPIAYFGLATYLVLGGLLLFGDRVPFIQGNNIYVIFGISLFAWMFSMYLVFVQFFLLKALCPWCLTHEAIFTLYFVVTCIQLYKEMYHDEDVIDA